MNQDISWWLFNQPRGQLPQATKYPKEGDWWLFDSFSKLFNEIS